MITLHLSLFSIRIFMCKYFFFFKLRKVSTGQGSPQSCLWSRSGRAQRK